ncbi:hypothetical protein [Planomonospora venezuelensis]|uniref:Uncharacterized membrane protein (DUF485 family) n=1 Tax=Planomonospora venezuelensis TaxID=1999 RepID=A0A841D941_PLAVE|nr:hypothetical protein [Planomonospora venezuelensis]MBB5966009.1 uncharacterized membrane protein (DUF485 family) [Planomonospora venezuelensis]GIN02353.1 hypothetical protein Pve01_40110 [Planomonospora venezuelensis]
MPPSWLARYGAACGVLLGLSIGVPGAVEAFTGETTATSFVIGLGAVLGTPALTAFYLHQSAAAGRFGAVAYAVNLIGLGLFAGVSFALNLVIFYLDGPVATALLAGPTRIAVFGGIGVFVVGTVLFGVSMLRARVFPRPAAWAYMVSLVLLTALAPLPDTPLTSAVHVAVCAVLVWLSASVWSAAAPAGSAGPQGVPAVPAGGR